MGYAAAYYMIQSRHHFGKQHGYAAIDGIGAAWTPLRAEAHRFADADSAWQSITDEAVLDNTVVVVRVSRPRGAGADRIEPVMRDGTVITERDWRRTGYVITAHTHRTQYLQEDARNWTCQIADCTGRMASLPCAIEVRERLAKRLGYEPHQFPILRVWQDGDGEWQAEQIPETAEHGLLLDHGKNVADVPGLRPPPAAMPRIRPYESRTKRTERYYREADLQVGS